MLLSGDYKNIDELVGLTIKSITVRDTGGDDRIIFETTCGRKFVMYHCRDCCEYVTLDDIVGDLQDLVGKKILDAYESSNNECGKWGESETWTFYRISSYDVTITIKWYGTSNGYYSESVDFIEVTEKE